MKLKFLVFLFIISNLINYNIYSLDGIIIPSINPGVFNNNIELAFDNSLDIDIYYFFEDSLDKTPIKYRYPLSLTAMSGELRSHKLVVVASDGDEILETKNLIYNIDKDIPFPAVLDKKDGIYSETLKLKFQNSSDSIYYTIQSHNSNKFKLWEGQTIVIPQNKNLNTDFIKSYSEDSAGNRTDVIVNRFTILPAPTIENTINIISPVEGVFLNNQLLYIDNTGFKWIRYSFNNVDPALRGTTYIKPVILKTIGEYNLKIAALPYNSNKVITKEINFSIISNETVIFNNESGVYTEEINLKFNHSKLHYNLDEREILLEDPVLPDTLSILPVPGIIKYRTLRIGNFSDSAEFRYLFVLDNKIPAAPIISVSSSLPVAKNTEVRIIGAPGADIFYTIDGSTPDRYSSYYKMPFKMIIPEGLNSGSMIIKAISYFNDKSTSLVTTKLLTFDIKKPESPIITVLQNKVGNIKFKISNILSNRIIYNVKYDGFIPENPDIFSFTGTENMVLTLPYGIEEKVSINIALVDRAGNISESKILQLSKSDTVAPNMPEIIYSNSEVIISGSDTIFYRIINLTKHNLEEFQLYEKPFVLEFHDNILNKFSIESYCIDQYGNQSDINIYSEIELDNRTPVFPEFSGIKNNGIYNKPISIRFHSSDNINVYYSISQSQTAPSDPVISESSKVSDFLYFDCPVNESRFFNVKMVAAYGEDKIVSSPVTLSFNIDRKAPRAPVISSIVNGGIYNSDLKINVNEKEDTVWILIKEKISEEDLNYLNFEMNGVLLSTGYTLIQPENTEKSYQIAALTIDSAENTNISREIINFTIDKILPNPPVIKEEFSSDNGHFIRMISETFDEILYETNFDGFQPPVPNIESNKYILPIEIQVENNIPVYISARTIDSAGNLSKQTSVYKIFFENSNLQTPVISIGKISSTLINISFATITGQKIFIKQGSGEFLEYSDPILLDLRNREFLDIFYYSTNILEDKSPVAVYRLENSGSQGNIINGILDDKIYNSGRVVWKANKSRTVRYEVAIDNEEPGSVTVFSPEITDPIVFDAANGESLTVSLNVKEFFDNRPVMEQYDTNFKFIIDKTPPPSPVIEGVANDGYYQDNLVLKLKSNDIVYYRVSSDIVSSYSLDYLRYSSPLKIKTSNGNYENFKIETYSEDSANNKSPINIINFSIDKANIYVSVKGKDGNNGSRLQPFRTINRALDYSELSGRKVIKLSEGEFLIDNNLEVSKNISIEGGYTLGRWLSGRGETLISVSKRFPIISPMVTIISGNVVISNITLSNSNLPGSLVHMIGGKALLSEVNLLHENIYSPVFINLINSDLVLEKCILSFNSIKSGNLFTSKNSSLDIINTSITGTGLSQDLLIFNLTKTNLNIQNSSINPSTGQRIEILNADNSDILIANSNINTGLGIINTNLFLLNNCKFKIESSEIISNNQSRILSCFNIKDSTVSIDGSNFNLLAESGISFIRIDNSSLELFNSQIYSEKTDEFLYLLNSNTSIVNFGQNLITTGFSDIVKGFELSNSVSIFNNNNIIFEGGDTVFTAFNFVSPLNIEFISNKMFSKNLSWISSEDMAVFTIKGGKDSISFVKNNIFGWKHILNYNGVYVNTTGELNNFRGFMDIPEGNYSNEE